MASLFALASPRRGRACIPGGAGHLVGWRVGWGAWLLCLPLLGCGASEPLDCSDAVAQAVAAAVEVDTSSPEALTRDVRALLDDPDPLRRASRLARLLPTLDLTHMPAVREGIESAALDRGDTELILFVEWWAGLNPLAAHHWSRQFWSARHGRVEAAAMRAWARQDPEAAIERVLSRTSLANTPTAHSLLVESAVVGWFELGKDGLVEWILGLDDKPLQQSALAALARMHVARDGPAAAIAWADAFSDEDSRAKQWLIQRVASAIALREPTLAAEYAERLASGDIYSHDVVRRVARRWSETDPLATLQWLEGFDKPVLRADAVQEVFKIWLRDDEAAAYAWLESRPGEEWLDPARRSIVLRRVNTQMKPNWELLAQETQKIQREDTRLSTLSWLLQHWRFFEEEAAQRWLAAQTAIPEEVRQKLLELPPKRSRAFRLEQAIERGKQL